jgi:hypothetical protein
MRETVRATLPSETVRATLPKATAGDIKNQEKLLIFLESLTNENEISLLHRIWNQIDTRCKAMNSNLPLFLFCKEMARRENIKDNQKRILGSSMVASIEILKLGEKVH